MNAQDESGEFNARSSEYMQSADVTGRVFEASGQVATGPWLLGPPPTLYPDMQETHRALDVLVKDADLPLGLPQT